MVLALEIMIENRCSSIVTSLSGKENPHCGLIRVYKKSLDGGGRGSRIFIYCCCGAFQASSGIFSPDARFLISYRRSLLSAFKIKTQCNITWMKMCVCRTINRRSLNRAEGARGHRTVRPPFHDRQWIQRDVLSYHPSSSPARSI